MLVSSSQLVKTYCDALNDDVSVAGSLGNGGKTVGAAHYMSCQSIEPAHKGENVEIVAFNKWP